MPDPSKLERILEIRWRERPVCGLCKHFVGRPGTWGRCTAVTYEHAKHNGTSQLGVHAYGGCRFHDRDKPRALKMLRSYADQ